MEIRFIKEYRAIKLNKQNASSQTFTYREGDVLDEVLNEEAQWLIDNGFAEEVKESGWWKPKNGERYYYLGSDGYVYNNQWENDSLDNARLKIGSVFKTEESTERYRDYQIAIATVRQDEGVLTPEQVNELGRNSGVAYYVGCVGKHNGGKMLCECKMSLLPWTPVGMILFDTKEHAQASQDKHSDEWKIIANYDWSRE